MGNVTKNNANSLITSDYSSNTKGGAIPDDLIKRLDLNKHFLPRGVSHESVIFSDEKTLTDDDQRGIQSLGNNLASFKNMMNSNKYKPPFDQSQKQREPISTFNLNSSINSKQSKAIDNHSKAANTMLGHHRRQISQGLVPSNPGLFHQFDNQQLHQHLQTITGGETFENIEPEDEEGLYGGMAPHFDITEKESLNFYSGNINQANKLKQNHSIKIENMQVGRARRKSNLKSSSKKNSNKKKSQLISIHNQVNNPTTAMYLGGSLQQAIQTISKQLSISKTPSDPLNTISNTAQQYLSQSQRPPEMLNKLTVPLQQKVVGESMVKNPRLDQPMRIEELQDDSGRIGRLQSNTKLNYQHIQSKTVESSSNSESEDNDSFEVRINLSQPEGQEPKQEDGKYQKYQGHNQDRTQFNKLERNLKSDDFYDILQNRSEIIMPSNLQSKNIQDLKNNQHSIPFNHGKQPQSQLIMQTRLHSQSHYADRTATAQLQHFQIPNLPHSKHLDPSFTTKNLSNPLNSLIPTTAKPQLSSILLSSSGPNTTVYNNNNMNQSSNMIKPLNKITWDSFSQIAKLCGDVDHEPTTPKSGLKVGIGANRGSFDGSSDEQDDVN